MKTASTFSIDFIIRLKKQQKERALIYARVTVNGNRTEISLKEEIIARNWDKKKEIVKGKSLEAKTIKNYIEDVCQLYIRVLR